MVHYVVMQGIPCEISVSIEGLDMKDHKDLEIIDKLGFMIDNGKVKKKLGVRGQLPTSYDECAILLQPHMYPSTVLNILQSCGYEIVSTVMSPAGFVVWTLVKQ